MSFITRCPTCSTAFRVVPDQIKLANGWVRCGHCNEVFEAILHRQTAGVGADAAPLGASEDRDLTHAPLDLIGDGGPEPVPPGHWAVSEPTVRVSEPPAAQAVQATQALHVDPWLMPAPAAATPSPPLRVSPDDTPLQELGFVRAALGVNTLPAWQHRALVAGVGFLGGTALLQALSFALGHAQVPVLTPLVKGWCAVAPCGQVEHRLVERMLIESTALIRQAKPGAYRYEMRVVNQSEHMMVPPALELTLIDANDAVLVKKVLTAAEWMPSSGAIRPRSHVQAQLALNLSAKDAAEMAGYRAVLFYP